MRLLIATDAWRPQVNGVVRTLDATIAAVDRLGIEVRVVSPDLFRTVPLPFYPQFRSRLPARAQSAGSYPTSVRMSFMW